MELDRRTFLKGASATALAGAVGSSSAAIATPENNYLSASGKYDFDTPYNRIETNCIKWDRQRIKFGNDKFKYGMGIATMDFRTAPCVTDALSARCKNEAWGYIDHFDSLIEAIVGWEKRRHHIDIDPTTIEISAGVYPGLIAALRTFSPPSSKVLLMTPTYSGFYYHIEHTRTVPSDSPLIYKNGKYEIDWKDLESRMTADTHSLILCNPQNPTGTVWSPEDLLRLGRLCLKNQIVVLSDEIHSDIIRSGHTYTPFASLPDKDVVNNSVTFNAISKTFNMAGMKTAYFHSTNKVFLERIRLNHRGDLTILGVDANEAAYLHGDEWLNQLLVYLDDNHRFVENYISKNIPLIGYKVPEATYLTWLDVSRLIDVIGAKEKASQQGITPEYYIQNWLVKKTGVFLNSGSKYGVGGANHMRMNIASSRTILKEALDSIANAVKKVS